MGWITKFTKSFTNDYALSQQKANGVTRKLVGFELKDRGIPRQSYPIVDSNAVVIGSVTSGTMSPSLKKGIGMGYVRSEFSEVGTEIGIKIRKKIVLAKVIKLPFYKG